MKIIPWFIVIFIAYILQSSLLTAIAYEGICVDLMMLIAVSISIIREQYAILAGFCIGLFHDLASGTFLGIHTFSLLIICFFSSVLSQRIYKENIFLPLATSVSATLLNNFIIALLIFLLGYNYNVWLVVNNALIALIYNLIFAYPVYLFVLKLDSRIDNFIKMSKQF